MKKIFLCAILLLQFSFIFANKVTYYVCYSTGLNIRKTPSLNAELIGKIPYATKLNIDIAKTDTIPVLVEGMTGFWAEVNYQNKKGYVLNCYLVSVAPPKKGTKKMADYLLQLSPKFGTELVVKKGSANNIYESGYEIKKQLYKNGNEYHHTNGYESFEDNYFLVGVNTVQEAFLIMRQIEEFNFFLTEKDAFPNSSNMYKRKNEKSEEIDFNVTVEKEKFYNQDWIKKIQVEFQEGATYMLQIFIMDNQIVISYGGGV